MIAHIFFINNKKKLNSNFLETEFLIFLKKVEKIKLIINSQSIVFRNFTRGRKRIVKKDWLWTILDLLVLQIGMIEWDAMF